MSGYQFIHVEAYGRTGSKLKGAKRAVKGKKRKQGEAGWSARQVCAEALREVQASNHVEHTMPPEPIFGDLQQIADDLDKLGPAPKGQRTDTPILMAGTASAPWPPGDPRSKSWRADVLEHLQTQFGENLRAVVGHNDEEHDHLHFYVAHQDYAPVKDIHVGMKARGLAEAEGGQGFELKKDYSDAMRNWQDQYFAEVAVAHGQARIGPRKQRINRSEWKAQQAANESIALALRISADAEKSAKQSKEVAEKAKTEARELIIRAQSELAEKKQLFEQQVSIRDAAFALEKSKLERRGDLLKVQIQAVTQERAAIVVERSLLQKLTSVIDAQKQALASVFKLLPMNLQERIKAVFAQVASKPPVPVITANAGTELMRSTNKTDVYAGRLLMKLMGNKAVAKVTKNKL